MTEHHSIRDQFCPNVFCFFYGKTLGGNVILHSRQVPRLKCKACEKTWANHHGKIHYGLRSPRWKMSQALEMLTIQVSIRKIADAIDVSPSTIQRWKRIIQNHIS